MPPIKIAFVITDLSRGGAQAMLCKLLSRLDRGVFAPEVVSLTGDLALKDVCADLGVPVQSVGMRRGVPDPRGVLRLVRMFKRSAPRLVQTWLYHADLIGGLAARLSGIPVIWNIRNGTLAPEASRSSTVLTARLCALLSRRLPARIVCCAESARDIHVHLGYAAERMQVIPNGFDTAVFRPDPAARRAVRRELAVAENALLVGLVARFHPQKDHRCFVQAAGRLRRMLPDVRFLLCGYDITEENRDLAQWIDAAGVRDAVRLLGARPDIPRLTAALDVAVSSSSCGEAFPNVLGEAMACGVPCAATRVGDSAAIVGDCGVLVEAQQPQQLAEAMAALLRLPAGERSELGRRGRERVQAFFSLEAVTRSYTQLFLDVCGESGPEAALEGGFSRLGGE